MSSINFDNPWLLLIAIPLALLLLLPFFLTVRKGNRNFHNVTSCVLHILIAVLVAFSAAGTKIESVVTETNVYVVADLSHSSNKNLQEIDGYIHRLGDKLPANSKMGVVCFGATDSHVIHTPLGEKPQSVTTSLSSINDSATDIVSALEYTGKIFKNNVIKRIVLITDAKQTDESDTSALKRTVDKLHASKIFVDAIYLDNNISKDAKEVQLSDVEYASTVYKGQDVTASVYLQSSLQTRVALEVACNKQPYKTINVDVGVGTRTVTIPLKTDAEGTYSYAVSLKSTDSDTSDYNNVQTFTQFVEAQPKTLFIVDDMGVKEDIDRAKALYGDSADVKRINDPTIPVTVSALCEYDEIVLSNVNVTKMGGNYETFIESLEVVVSDLGKSLVGYGDLGLQNATGTMKILADMMPVTYGNPIKGDRFFAILMDLSNSMFRAGKFDIAKKTAASLVDLLKPTDKVAVIGFHGQWSWIQTPTLADKPEDIKKKIMAAEDDHGTVIHEGLNAVENELLTYANGLQSQVFLLSDGGGIDNAAEYSACMESVDNLYEKGITTSVMAIGVRAETDLAIVNNLKSLAYVGNGEVNGRGYWELLNDAALDESVFKEEISGSDLAVTAYTNVQKKERFDEVLEGIGELSYIQGYMPSYAKTDATTVLEATYWASNGGALPMGVDVPIYAYKNYGNGKTSAFTSYFGGEAIANWDNLGISTKLFKNIYATNVPKERVAVPFTVSTTKYLGGASVEIRPCAPKVDAVAEVALIAPDGTESVLPNVVFDGSKYTCSFVMPTEGEYTTKITYTYKNETYTVQKAVSLPYLSEYDEFTTFYASPLYQMLGSKGTVSEDGELEIVNDESEVGMEFVDLTVPLLIAAVVLFAVDIIIRKLKWADIKGLFKKVKKENKS